MRANEMTIPKKYVHDRIVLLLISINAFLVFLLTIWILFKLDSGRSAGYIVQYRANLGIGALKTGEASELVAFMVFGVFVLVAHTLLSIKAYPIRRHVSIVILGLGTLLLLLALIVSNALLVLR
ncbi:MAG TPA: hypothetical protein VK983_05860 [Candidatus Limnocylindrales bacterium]|nr:hypothetical protein [Candidatus Limnocylindrales bacterium]